MILCMPSPLRMGLGRCGMSEPREAFPAADATRLGLVALLHGMQDRLPGCSGGAFAPMRRWLARAGDPSPGASPGLVGCPIVYVPGNHEFYRGCFEERLAAGKAACVATRVHMLDRDTVVLAGVRFVGAILWTDYRLSGDPERAMDVCRRGMNDHRLIQVGTPGSRRLFRPEDAVALHARDRAFIQAELAITFEGPTVIVTHHGPHPGSVATRYARDPATSGFVSDLGDVIRRGRPEMWIHGHVHDGFDYRVGATRVLANPKGYGPKRHGQSPENGTFDSGLVLEVRDEEAGYDARAISVLRASLAPLTIAVTHWTILRVLVGGDRHVLGYRIETGRGRTSSPIRSFDRRTMTATTSSGNRYRRLAPIMAAISAKPPMTSTGPS